MKIEVSQTWDGQPIEPEARVDVSVFRRSDTLQIEIDAPLWHDPPPRAPPGELWGLWDFEVVEVFLLGTDEHYLEIELGPWGHHLVLSLQGRRNVVARRAPLTAQTTRGDHRWRGQLGVPWAWVPKGVKSYNIYAIHGVGADRRHLAAHPVPGAAPDFHRLEHFGDLAPDWAASGSFASG